MTLIKDISIIRAHVSIDSSLTLEILQPHLNFVERYFKKVLGTAEYLALNSAVGSESTSLEQDALLEQIYPSMSRLAVAGFTVVGGLSISGSGARRVETSNEKTPYKYQEEAMVKRLIQEGFELMDDMVEFLEENEDDYSLWKNDAVAYVKFKQFFINTAEEFNNEYGINGSRLTFRAFYSLLKSVDFMVMRPVLGSNYYDELKSEIQSRNLTSENEELLANYIRPAVAHLVIADAMDQLAVEISETGVRVIEQQQSFPGDIMARNAPEDVRDAKKANAQNRGKKLVTDLQNELKDNASESKYATYYAQMGVAAGTDHNTTTTNSVYRA